LALAKGKQKCLLLLKTKHFCLALIKAKHFRLVLSKNVWLYEIIFGFMRRCLGLERHI